MLINGLKVTQSRSEMSRTVNPRNLLQPVSSSLFSSGCSNDSLGSKRAPLPPQQTSFRSARLRDPPPHPTSTPSKRPEDNARAGVVEDGLPRQPRNSSSAVQPLDVNRPPNGGDLHRFLDGHERQERPPIWDGASHSDKRANVIRDDSSRIERRQLGPTDRRLPEEVLRPSNIPLDSDGRGSLRPRGSVNDNGQRDSNHDKVKDEKHREGGDRDVRPQFEQNNVRTLYYTDSLYLSPLTIVSPDAEEMPQASPPASLEQTTYRSVIVDL